MKTKAAIYPAKHPDLAPDTQAESVLILNAQGEISSLNCAKDLSSPQLTVNDAALKEAEKPQSELYLDRIAALNSHINNMDQGMRMRLSRDLHDATSSNLSSILMYLDVIQALPAESQASYVLEHLSDIRALTEDSIKSIGDVCADLRLSGIENQLLRHFIENESQKFQLRTGLPVNLNISVGDFGASLTIKLTVQRAFIELMSNIARHANASSIEVDLQFDANQLSLSVSDNGCGFDTNSISGRHGIKGMRELVAQSGGTLTINSSLQSGTKAVLEFTGKFEKINA